MSDKQSNLTDKEMEDLQSIVTDTLASVCAMADKHNIDRDSMLKYFADMLTAFTEVASIQNYETNHTCNCQHNSNSRENEPCCGCDNRTAKINKARVNSLEIIARMLDDKPYYELKYRQVGKKDYSIGYSSYDLKTVLGYINTFFEIAESEKQTHADKIRNMSDEELADFLDIVGEDGISSQYADVPCDCCCEKTECSKCWKDWLKSEAE
jgi:hypothetical protein